MQKLQLSIPEPCHENWDHMTPTQQGRFCNACAKEVVDFSEMSDTEVLNYFNKNITGKVCGRAYPDQLDRVIAMPEKPKRKWYWNYAAAFFLFFAKSNVSKAQGVVAFKPNANDTVKQKPTQQAQLRIGGISSGISVKEGPPLVIIDGFPRSENELNKIDPDDIASIDILKGTQAGALFGEAGAKNGVIIVRTKKKNEVADTVPVYRELDVVKVSAASSQIRKGSIGFEGMLGGMTAGMSIKFTIADTLKSFVKNIVSPLKIYPNPVLRGQVFNVAFTAKQNTSYIIQVINTAGVVLSRQKVTTAAKECTQQLQVNSHWAAGMYYAVIFDDKNKLINKSSFIVQ